MKLDLKGMSAWCIAATILASPCAFAQERTGLTATSIRIGSFGALTGPGYLYGKLAMNGIEVVFDEVNSNSSARMIAAIPPAQSVRRRS
jgi:branched-chain amino acid transport system substrate-binding protein